MNKLLIFAALFALCTACGKKTFVQMTTSQGEIVLKLYDETPFHKENFIKLVEEGFYDSLLFHRVIDDFVIQGGDPQSRGAEPGILLGNGGPDYKVPAEFNDSLFHKKGALAAARGGHPQKASNGSQFYIVDGKPFTDADLDRFEKADHYEGHEFSPYQREFYTTIGGLPFLDLNYTVFGEVVAGMNIVESIAASETDSKARPVEDVLIIEAKMIKFKQAEDRAD